MLALCLDPLWRNVKIMALCRVIIQYANKALLVVCSWSSYSSMLLVCCLFFWRIARVLVREAVFLTVTLFFSLGAHVMKAMPMTFRIRMEAAASRSWLPPLLWAVCLCVCLYCVKATQSWQPVVGAVARLLLAMIGLSVVLLFARSLPGSVFGNVTYLVLALALIPMSIAEIVIKKTAVFVRQYLPNFWTHSGSGGGRSFEASTEDLEDFATEQTQEPRH